ncbi:MAG: ribose 5-phosphate isomerase B [Ignavibacteria bacterium]|nr:ribose 5-phosphate isomerase B [Ignavibacteria bacterium]
MKVAIGSDHAGFKLKEKLKAFLTQKGFEVLDKGCFSEESCDYPDYGEAVALEVVNNNCDFGCVICGTGIGISIAANKIPGIRAALCTSKEMAQLAKAHNNANIIAIGARINLQDSPEEILEAFINSKFEGGRHERRINKITNIEERYKC